MCIMKEVSVYRVYKIMDLEVLKVTPAKQKQFAVRGIYTVEDLLQYLPKKYKDYSKITGLLPGDQVSCFQATLKAVEIRESKVKSVLARCIENTSGRYVFIRWFNATWMYRKICAMVDHTVTVIGKAEFNEQYQSYSVIQPEVFEISDIDVLGIYPVYKSVPGMSYEYLTGKMQDALDTGLLESEDLPEDIIGRTDVVGMPTALRYIHMPKTMEEVAIGQKRILFNDLIYFAIHNELNARSISAGSPFNVKSRALEWKIQNGLPFKLTEDQQKAVNELIDYAMKGKRINCLLQADVGAGKTICAALVAASIIDSGYQAALMAPTQVLAKQHYETMQGLLGPYGIEIVFLFSGMKKKERTEALAKIADGTAQMIVGTHSCIANDVNYHKLALTIVDEEHKFGVAQRSKIIEKAAMGVHNITMSATPIPRSLAQVVYGDEIQLQTIRSMPEGRKPVITGIGRDKGKTFRFLLKEVKAGHQAYVVCPVIDPSEKLPNLKSVEEVRDEYESVLGPYGVRIATLTGRDSKEQTEATIQAYKNGDYDVLIATTVIEVGVNVPNATMMIITNAERFGLSGLHQLRGRVGRSDLQSYCVLQSDAEDDKAMARLNAMVSTTDGFQIAEADLKLRGAGDFLGTQQSGDNKYVSLMLAYPEQYEKAKEYARELINRGADSCDMMRLIENERE